MVRNRFSKPLRIAIYLQSPVGVEFVCLFLFAGNDHSSVDGFVRDQFSGSILIRTTKGIVVQLNDTEVTG